MLGVNYCLLSQYLRESERKMAGEWRGKNGEWYAKVILNRGARKDDSMVATKMSTCFVNLRFVILNLVAFVQNNIIPIQI